jgi:hypothetical protein
MEAAKEQVAPFAAEGVDCDLRRRPAYVSTRFTPDGEILNGPATKPLPSRPA